MTCNKGYMWNPSTCACEYDMWCKPGQYLNYKKCVCKNKLIGKVISKCTSLINETMISNKMSITNGNNDIYFILFIIFSILCILLIIGLIYYYRKNSNKKILNKMYNIDYSCDNSY